MKKYPLKLDYTAKSAIWGGNILANQWGKLGEGDNVAETWELTVREKEMSKITNGEGAGMTLAQYIELCGGDAVSRNFRVGDRFPLLVKFIDARDRLSVQVHPDDAYASRVEGDSGKTEMWYIVDAEEGAEIIYGLSDGATAEDFANAVAAGVLDPVMKRIAVKKGDSFFIPAGMLHAIGGGILIAEIQQNSDLTYRVYDYDRVGADGKKRELHTEKALDVVRPYSDLEIEEIRFAKGRAEDSLANSEFFGVTRKDINESQPYTLTVSEDSFVSLLCTEGCGRIELEGESYAVCRGDSYFLPAGMGKCVISGELTVLCSRL